MSTRSDGSSQGPRPTLPPPGGGGAAILGSSSWAECPVVKGAFPWGLAVCHVFSDRLCPWPETSVCPQTYGPFPGPSRGTLLFQASCRGALCREGLPALPRALGLRPGTVCAALRAGQVSPPLPQGPPGSSPSCTPLPWAPPSPPWSGRWDGSAVGLLASHRLSLLRGGRRGRLQQWRRLGLGSSEGQEGGQWGRGLQARAGTQADLGGPSLRRCWGLACGLEFLVAFLLETNLELEFQERRNLKLRKQPHPRQARTVGQSSWPVMERPGRRAPQGHLASRRLSPPGAGCPRGCPRG